MAKSRDYGQPKEHQSRKTKDGDYHQGGMARKPEISWMDGTSRMAVEDDYTGLRVKAANRLDSRGLSVIADHTELHRALRTL